ncbi:MAG: hypothetical protein AB1609_13620 [Bacillota bacterium]
MLEGCRNLGESEARIRDFVTTHGVNLLGEIPLSEEDVAWLDAQVRVCFQHDARLGTQSLIHETPLSFATFLVWQGIRGYRDGDYWSTVHTATGVPEVAYQSGWGHGFLKTLAKYHLLTPADDPGFAYVGPILLHGGVPDSCLAEYFREVCWKFLVSQGLTQEKEVTVALAQWRQDAERVNAVRRELQAVENEISECQRLLKLCDTYIQRRETLIRLRKQAKLLAEASRMYEEVAQLRATQEELFEELRDAQRRIDEYSRHWQELLATKALALEHRVELDKAYGQIEAAGRQLSACTQGLNELATRVFGRPWVEALGEPVLRLDGTALKRARDELKHLIERKARAKAQYRNLKIAGGVGLGVAPLLRIFTGYAWPTAVTLGLALTLVALGKRWFIRAIRAIRTEEQSIRAVVPPLPWVADPLCGDEGVLADIDRIQHLLVERCTLRETLQQLHMRLLDMEHRTGGARAGGGPSPVPETAGTATGERESSSDLASRLNLWNLVDQRVEQWLADISEAERRQEAAAKAQVQVVDLAKRMDELAQVIEEKQGRLGKTKAALLDLGVPVPPEDKVGYSALKETRESVRARVDEAAAAFRRARAELGALVGSEVTPEEVDEYKRRINERLRAAWERRAGIMTAAGVSTAHAHLDRPTERFLTHGGQWADKFVVVTVALLAATLRSGEPRVPAGWPRSYRYQRVYDVFQSWWAKEGQDLCAERIRRLPSLRLVAWKEGGEWALGIRIPEALLSQPQLEVTQGKSKLALAPREGCWYLDNLSDEVLASGSDYQGIRLDVTRYRYRDMPLVVCQGWEGDRRLLPAARRIGRAKRLVIFFPATWELSKPHWPVDPVGRPPGYQACYVDLAETGCIPFVDGQGVPVTVDLGGETRFELVGNVLPIDRDHDQGPLFIGEPPRLRCLQEELLTEVAWLELVPGGAQVRPSSHWLSTGVTLALPEPSGCFEVVVYDRQGTEMERLPFRYAAHLRGVYIQRDPDHIPSRAEGNGNRGHRDSGPGSELVPVFPEREGHPKLKVHFDACPGCTVELKKPRPESRDGSTGVTKDGVLIPPHPDWDRTVWELRSEGGRPVPIELVLQRIWWAAGECGHTPAEWTDRIITVAPDWVRAASDKALWLRCEPGTVRPGLKAGFGDALRPYRLDRTGVVEIPLREYCDLIGAAQDREHVFRVWIQGRDGAEAAGQIALYKPPVPAERCFFCITHTTDLPAEELTKSCATCNFCQLRCHGEEVFCSSGQWSERRLPKRDFERLMATNLCDRWDGEYPGEPFGWEATRLIGARVRTKVELEEIFGTPTRGEGLVSGAEAGRLCVRWDSPAGAPTTWFCRYHYDKFCTEASQT